MQSLASYDKKGQKAFERFQKESIFSLFPRFLASLVKSGEILTTKKDQPAFQQGQQVDSIFILIGGAASIQVETGVPTSEDLFEVVEFDCPLNLTEVLNRKRIAYSLISDEDSHWITVSRPSFLEALSDNPGLEIYLRVFCSCLAFRNLSRYLIKEKISETDLIALASGVDTSRQIMDSKTVNEAWRKLILVNSGRVFFQRKEDQFALGSGDFFGASLLNGDKTYNLTVSGKVRYYSISFDRLDAKLLDRIQAHLVKEPCFPVVSGRQERVVGKGQMRISYQQHDLSLLPKLIGPLAERARNLLFSADSRSWAEATVGNWALLMGIDHNQRDLKSYFQNLTRVSPLRVAKYFERLNVIVHSSQLQNDLNSSQNLFFTLFESKPILVLSVKMGKVFLLDPSLGLISVAQQDFLASWSGQILQMDIEETDQNNLLVQMTPDSRLSTAKQFISSNQQSVHDLTINFVFLDIFLVVTSILIPPLFVGLTTQTLQLKNLEALPLYLTGLAIAVLFQILSCYLKNIFAGRAKWTLSFRVHSLFFRQYLASVTGTSLAQGAQFLGRPIQFEWYQGVTNAVRSQGISQIASFTIFLAMIAFYSVTAAGIVLFVSALIFSFCYYFAKYRASVVNGMTGFRLELYDNLNEYATAFASVKSNGVEKYFQNLIGQKLLNWFVINFEMSRFEATRAATVGTLIQILTYSVLFLIVRDSLQGQGSAASVWTLSLYMGFVAGPILALGQLIGQKAVSESGAEFVLPPAQSKRAKAQTDTISTQLRGAITLEKVGFRYFEGGPLCLVDLNLTISPGQFVAIVGRSGSGKTTLARLLAAQSYPSQGRVCFDDYEIRELSQNVLREQIGFVAQNLELFSGTVLSNIAYDDDSPDLEQIKASARSSNSNRFINHLPSHYFYALSEGGVGLSTGQKNQIAMARALYRNPQILVVDEATANLDPESEKAVSDGVLKQMDQRTMIVVIHRLYAARKADLIVVMKNGRIVEQGRHEDLIRKNGEYTELYRHQVGLEIS